MCSEREKFRRYCSNSGHLLSRQSRRVRSARPPVHARLRSGLLTLRLHSPMNVWSLRHQRSLASQRLSTSCRCGAGRKLGGSDRPVRCLPTLSAGNSPT